MKTMKGTKEAITVLLLLFPAALFSASPYRWSASGKNLAALYSAPIQVFLPSVLPKEYVLFDYEIDHGNYSVTYLRDKEHWFRIESTDSAGDVDWDDSQKSKIQSKRFGEITLQIAPPGPGEPLKTNKLITDWIPCPGAPKDPKRWPRNCRFYHLFGYGVTAEEVGSVMESLAKQKM
jgi:hypothetical protein